ncbi:MAG: type I methionyl aminopeptidase [bacterium]|nr:type I methionyl aminopeptidase [bacterium]
MTIERDEDLAGLQRAGAVVSQTLRETASAIMPGVRTRDLDDIAAGIYHEHGARSAPTLQFGFPGHTLASVNDEVVHGIPGDRVLSPGDIVTVDVTVELDGFIADAARTICVPPISPLHKRLHDVGRDALSAGTSAAVAGRRVSVIGRAVNRTVRSGRLTVIRELTGHGTGRAIWEEPMVPNFHDPRQRDRLHEGLVLTIEPIVTSGTGRIYEDDDGWTVRTADRAPASHWEDTMVITRGIPPVLTN